jgi:DNA-binding LacI/PurR family transcriptional regulator
MPHTLVRGRSLQTQAEWLADVLRRRLRHYLPASTLPPRSQLSRQFRVSPRVVRRAVELLVQERLVEIHARRGVWVCQQPPQGSAIRVIVAVTLQKELADPVVQQILLGADRHSSHWQLKFQVQTCPGLDCDSGTLEDLASRLPAAGWMFVSARPASDLLLAWRMEGRSVVLVDQSELSSLAHTVNGDDHGAAFAVTERLILMGHRRIAYVGRVHLSEGEEINRIHGFRLAHRRHGLAVDASIIHDSRGSDIPVNEICDQFVRRRAGATAVVGSDQLYGCELLLACRRQSVSVPGDLSVTCCGLQRRGLDKKALSRLSRMDEGSPEELGRLAVEVLRHVHSATRSNLILPDARWIECGSTGPPAPECVDRKTHA